MLPVSMTAQAIDYDQYLKAVGEKNVSYLAEQYNVDIAVANLQAARVFNDPELSVDYANNQDWNLYMGKSWEFGLSYDLDLAGVRRARIRTARNEKEITEASVVAYLSNLRFEAAQAWGEAWRLKQSCDVMQAAVDDMRQIAQSDSVRLSVGDIGSTDATQSRLEAQALEGELIAMKAEYENALMNLSMLCGGEPITAMDGAMLPQKELAFSEEELLRMAEYNRADLKAAELSHTLSVNNLRLVKAERAMGMSLNLGYSYNTEVRNEIAPAPKYNGISVGIAIPLKFSSLNKGERRAAEYQVAQSQKYYEASLLQIHTETQQALNAYEAAKVMSQQYDSQMMSDARQIVESRKVGYQKGDTNLVELLAAQQTYRDVMQAYIEACYNRFVCCARLEKCVCCFGK